MYGKKRPGLTPSQQLLLLKQNPVCIGRGGVSRGKLNWRFSVQPTPLSRIYEVEVTYREGNSPDVFVRDPDIRLLAGSREVPHIYHNPLRLCLYLPRKHQWHSGLRIDQTIIPWTYLWLYYFEEWLVSDEWKGGGEHPDPDDSGNRLSRRFGHSIARSREFS